MEQASYIDLALNHWQKYNWRIASHGCSLCFYQTRSSGKFKRVMQTILSLGNALNQGTARGELLADLFNGLNVWKCIKPHPKLYCMYQALKVYVVCIHWLLHQVTSSLLLTWQPYKLPHHQNRFHVIGLHTTWIIEV